MSRPFPHPSRGHADSYADSYDAGGAPGSPPSSSTGSPGAAPAHRPLRPGTGDTVLPEARRVHSAPSVTFRTSSMATCPSVCPAIIQDQRTRPQAAWPSGGPADRRVQGSIPIEGMSLGAGSVPGPGWGPCGGDQWMFLLPVAPSPSTPSGSRENCPRRGLTKNRQKEWRTRSLPHLQAHLQAFHPCRHHGNDRVLQEGQAPQAGTFLLLSLPRGERRLSVCERPVAPAVSRCELPGAHVLAAAHSALHGPPGHRTEHCPPPRLPGRPRCSPQTHPLPYCIQLHSPLSPVHPRRPRSDQALGHVIKAV